MRQSGLLAAAALYALDHNVERLANDHANAKALASGIDQIDGLNVNIDDVQTNIVCFKVEPALGSAASICKVLDFAGVRMFDIGPQMLRAVTHLGISSSQIAAALEKIKSVVRDSVQPTS